MAKRDRKRGARGQGTVYEEKKPNRNTKWVAEKHVRLPDGTRRRIRARAETQGEALAELDRKIARARQQNPAADRLTMEAFMERWLAHKKGAVRASTHHHYERDNELYIKPHLGGVRLGRLSAYQAQKMLNAILAEGHHSMADRVRRTLKQALRQAVKWDLLEANPLDKLDPIRKPPVERGVWGPDEIAAFLEEAEGDPYYLVFVLALTTGMRKGEILGLHWEDVGVRGIHVRRTLSRRAEKGVAAPKTSAGRRVIPIAEHVRGLLLARRGKAKDHHPIFPATGTRPSKGAYCNPRTVTQHMDDIADRAGVESIRFHDLRRTYATMLARDGRHPRVIQKLLGHSTPTLAMTIYTDVLEEQEREAVIHLPSGGGQSGGGASGHEHTRKPEGGDD